jgi:hypothetical protein
MERHLEDLVILSQATPLLTVSPASTFPGLVVVPQGPCGLGHSFL